MLYTLKFEIKSFNKFDTMDIYCVSHSPMLLRLLKSGLFRAVIRKKEECSMRERERERCV